jgi:hypothetical protein
MPLLTTTPIKATMPTTENKLKLWFMSTWMKMTPMDRSGMVAKMMNGSTKLSNCPAMTAKTRRRARRTIITSVGP